MSDINKLPPQVQMLTQQQLQQQPHQLQMPTQQLQMPTQQLQQQPQQNPFIYKAATESESSTLVKTEKYQMPEPNSFFWKYTFPSNYHPLIDSDNLEFFEHYHNIVTDAYSDKNIRKKHINKLKEMMILKKTAYPQAAMFWITIISIIVIIYLIVYFNEHFIQGAIVWGILMVACVFWYIFAKSSGNINWNEFINIANGTKSMKEKLAYFEKERDAANNLQIARESRSNRSSVGSNLGAAVVGYFIGQSKR
jgi:hypothetical protein